MNEKNMQQEFQEEELRIKDTISKIKHSVVVFSGKGGVGKTTVSINLAYGFQLKGFKTGILDADITGPNVPKMLGVDSHPGILHNMIIPHEKFGLKIISVAGLVPPGKAVIWRGPMRSKIINQFLADVRWGDLDYMVADLPPGTGDEILTITQQLNPDFAVIVTTPQEVSIIDAERAIDMAKELKIPNIGIVENMSGFLCPHCKNKIDLYGSGGGKKLAKQYNLQFLGSIPFDIDTRISSDSGIPVISKTDDSAISLIIDSITSIINESILERRNDNKPDNNK
jgi:ATP-binding protein involved in chromosome partitioning